MQDIAGTLQGNWFYGKETTAEAPWDRHLAFVHDAGDPSKAVISIGGTISAPIKQAFTPSLSGVIGREFSHVTPDGNIYCYSLGSGKLVLRMKSTSTLEIERQDGACNGGEQLANPVLYDR